MVLLLGLLFGPRLANAGPPPIPPGQEDAILELVAPIELGDRLYASHILHSMTIEGATIVFWIAPPDLEDPKDGSKYGQIRLYHPDFGPEGAKSIRGFAMTVEEPGESHASVQKVTDRIEANADGSFWGFEPQEGTSIGGTLAPPPAGRPWRVFVFGLVLLASFGLALRDHEHALLGLGLVVVGAAMAAVHGAELCDARSILGRALRAPMEFRVVAGAMMAGFACVSVWLMALRLGLSTLAALASALAFGMSPWLVSLAGADAQPAMVAMLLVVGLALALEAACRAPEQGAPVLLGAASMFCLALAFRGSTALMVGIVLVSLLRRTETTPGHARWLLCGGLFVAIIAGLPPYLERGTQLGDVAGAGLALLVPATGHPLATALAVLGLLAPERSKNGTADVRWVGLAWLVLALSTGSVEMAAAPWALLAGRGFAFAFDSRPRLARGMAIVLGAGVLLAGVTHGGRGETPQNERCS